MNIEVDGIDVNYRIQVEGEVLLLLHGWGAGLRCFDRIFREFSARFRVISLDLPGFGLSGDPPGEWAVGEYADFVASFMRRLGISHLFLLGHSFGGRIAIKLASGAVTAPAVRRLVLTGSAGLRRKRPLGGRIRGWLYRQLRRCFRFSGAARLFPEAYDNLGRRFASRDYLAATPLMRRCLVKVVNEDLSGALPEITAPTLLIWGAGDTETPADDGRRMRDLIPGSRLEILENAGHFAFLDCPDRFSALLEDFLK